jgi:hypothetical protein
MDVCKESFNVCVSTLILLQEVRLQEIFMKGASNKKAKQSAMRPFRFLF